MTSTRSVHVARSVGLAAVVALSTIALAASAGGVAAQGDGTVSVSLEPAETEVTVGDETTFDVVVDGPANGVNSFALNVTLTNGSVASITDYAYNQEPDFGDTDVVAGNNSVRFAAAQGENTYDGADSIVLGNVTVSTDAVGTTDLVLSDVGVADNDDTQYEVTDTQGATLESAPESTPTPTETDTATATDAATETEAQTTPDTEEREETTAGSAETTAGDGPGFGAVATLVALAVLALFVGRRSR